MKKAIFVAAVAAMTTSPAYAETVRASASLPQAKAGTSLAVPAGTRVGPRVAGKSKLVGATPLATAVFVGAVGLIGFTFYKAVKGSDISSSASPF